MRNQNVERDLKRLVAPPTPADLRARCVATLPEGARQNALPAKFPRRHVVWKAVGGLCAAAVVVFTLLGTLAINSGKTVAGNVVFAQTVEAMRNIEAFHMSGKVRNTEKGGWQSNDWWETESWIDTTRGAYSKSTNCPYGTSLLPARFAKTIESLGLPDGTVYEKGNSQVVVEKHAPEWQKLKGQIGTVLLGDLATTSSGADQTRYFNTGGKLQFQFTQEDSWQGQKARLFTFEGKASSSNSKAPTILKKVYVDMSTNRVIAAQEFAVFGEQPPQLMSVTEVDYQRPDAALFDPVKFEEGTTRISKEAPYRHP